MGNCVKSGNGAPVASVSNRQTCTGDNSLIGSICVSGSPKNSGDPDCAKEGNPIHSGTGNKYQEELDVAGIAGFPQGVSHFTNSQVAHSFGWSFNWDAYRVYSTGSPPTTLTLQRPGNKLYIFTLQGSVWTSEADLTGKLERIVDAASNITTGWRYTTADGEIETYSLSRIASLTNRLGWKWIFTWTGSNYTVTDPFGRQLSFGVDAQTNRTMTTPSNNLYTYRSDANKSLTSVTYPGGAVRSYVYEDTRYPQALTGIIDENGNRYATWTYDAQGRAITSEHAGGAEKVTLTYNADGTTAVTDALNTTRTRSFATVLGVIKSSGNSQPGGSGCSASSAAMTYDANGNVAARTDFNGNQTRYTYDLARNLETSHTEAYGTSVARTISTSWHSYWRLPLKIAEPLKLTTYKYNGDAGVYCAPTTALVGTQPIGVVCSKTEQATTDANGSLGLSPTVTGTARTWAYTYDAYGQVLTANGPRTDVTDLITTTYYTATDTDLGKRGNVATVTNAAGHLTSITAYTLEGRPLTIVDPNGVTTTLAYDLRGRLTSRSVGLSGSFETTNYTYDGVGQLLQVALPDLSTLNYTYDAAHRLTDITDGPGNTITYTLDALGNRTAEEVRDTVGALARTRSHVYDALSRLYKDIGASSQTTTYSYDANGNLTGITDPLSHITTNTYDALNRLIQMTDPTTGKVNTTYNGQSQVTKITDPRSKATTYTVNGLGNQTKQVSPDSGTTTYTYDAAGNMTKRTDAKSQASTYQYDALNRVTQITYKDGSKVINTYDTGTNGKGRLTQIQEFNLSGSVTSTIAYTYDASGRILTDSRSLTGVTPATATTSYRTTNGRLSGMTYPSGRQMNYTLDSLGRITQIQLQEVGGATTTLASNAQYHPFDRLKSYQDGANRIHTYPMDQDGRLTSYLAGTQSWLINYDAASRLTSQTSSNNATNTVSYGYDTLDRLTSTTLPTGTLPAASYAYGYDATGNRTSQTIGSTVRTYTIASTSNRLSSVASPTVQTYTTDANGSITSDGSTTYIYDVKGRLSQVGTTTYQHNALGQRVRKTGTGVDTIYLYDLEGQLIGEASATGTTQKEYVWLNELPISLIQGGQTYAIDSDHLGTPRAVINSAGTPVWQSLSLTEAFGTTQPNENPFGLGSFIFNLRFPGQYYDQETGLSYNYFRSYRAANGRYDQADPIGMRGGINGFSYVLNSPLRYVDPYGLNAALALGAGAGSAGSAGAAASAGSGAASIVSTLGPGAAVIGAGAFGYGFGTLIYPAIEPGLSAAVDWCMSSSSKQECYDNCYSAYRNQVRICKIAPTAKARAQCYARASDLHGQCRAACK